MRWMQCPAICFWLPSFTQLRPSFQETFYETLDTLVGTFSVMTVFNINVETLHPQKLFYCASSTHFCIVRNPILKFEPSNDNLWHRRRQLLNGMGLGCKEQRLGPLKEQEKTNLEISFFAERQPYPPIPMLNARRSYCLKLAPLLKSEKKLMRTYFVSYANLTT